MFTRLWQILKQSVLKFWNAVSIQFSGLKSEEIAGIHSVKDILKYVLGNAVQKITHKEASRRVRFFADMFLKFTSWHVCLNNKFHNLLLASVVY